jgi:hypothetical protein
MVRRPPRRRDPADGPLKRPLPHSQSVEHLRKRKPFTGCNAGHSFFHVDPHGMASICKILYKPTPKDLLNINIEHLSDELMEAMAGYSTRSIEPLYEEIEPKESTR